MDEDRVTSHHIYIHIHTYSPSSSLSLDREHGGHSEKLDQYSLESVNLLPGVASALALPGMA